MGEKFTLKRELGILEITLSGVGSILGAGIYVLIGKASGLSGNALWLSFLFAAIAAGLTAISYMKLSSMFPKAGAEYEYVRNAFGEFLGLLIGLMVVFVEIISSSTVALGFAGYFGVLFHTPAIPSAIALILLFTLILLVGIKQSARAAILMTVIEVLGLFVIIFIGLPFIGSVDYLEVQSLSGIFEASALVFFAFLGFEEIVKLSQETKDPHRTTPRALILAIAITVLLYMLVAVAAVSVLDWRILSTSSVPLAEVASVALGRNAFVILSLIALFSTANTVLLMQLGGSRILYGMAESGSLPSLISRVHPRTRTPWVSILVFTAISIMFVFIGDIAVVANMANFMVFIVFITINLSLIWLRYSRPYIERPFKIPFNIGSFPLSPLFGILCTLLLFAHLSLEVIVYGFILLLVGFMVVFIRLKSQSNFKQVK